MAHLFLCTARKLKSFCIFFILKWILFTVLLSPFHLLRNNFLAVIIGRTILVSWLVTTLYFHSQIRHGILKHKWGSYNQWQWGSKIQLQCFTIWLEMTDCNLDYSVLQLMLNCQQRIHLTPLYTCNQSSMR